MQFGDQPSLLYRIEKDVLHARRHVLVEHQEAAGEEEQEAGQHSAGAGCEVVYRQAQCEGRAAGKELQGEWSEGHQGRGGQPGDFEKQVKVQDLAALQYSWRFWSSEAAAVAERMLDFSSRIRSQWFPYTVEKPLLCTSRLASRISLKGASGQSVSAIVHCWRCSAAGWALEEVWNRESAKVLVA